MRRVVASLFTTLDGVVETPEKWHFPYFNEEMGAIVQAQMSDTLLMGRGDLIEAVTRLKSEPGNDIAVSGSISIIRQLLGAGLVDELQLLVDPVAVRSGMRLFEETGTALPLELISSTTLTNGVLHLVYGPVGAGPRGNYKDASKAMSEATQKSVA